MNLVQFSSCLISTPSFIFSYISPDTREKRHWYLYIGFLSDYITDKYYKFIGTMMCTGLVEIVSPLVAWELQLS